MCTVSYVPLRCYDFILTSNRDEAVSRAAVNFPVEITVNDQRIIFPQDQQAGGSWIATSKKITVCLLNGAFVKHDRKLPYKTSRGLMLLAAFEYVSVNDFLEKYDFKGIEPFTVVLVYKAEEVELYEVRWDGERIYFKELQAHKPHIWASATLYQPEIIAQRQQTFNSLMDTFGYTQEEIIAFHSFKNDDYENGIMMDRGEKKTVSITSVASMGGSVTMMYNDLLSHTIKLTSLEHESTKI